jgi:hypothetical protein
MYILQKVGSHDKVIKILHEWLLLSILIIIKYTEKYKGSYIDHLRPKNRPFSYLLKIKLFALFIMDGPKLKQKGQGPLTKQYTSALYCVRLCNTVSQPKGRYGTTKNETKWPLFSVLAILVLLCS